MLLDNFDVLFDLFMEISENVLAHIRFAILYQYRDQHGTDSHFPSLTGWLGGANVLG